MTITAAVDGSSLGNPGPSGWAWFISDDRWAAGGWKSGTNNLGELTAVLELLRATEEAGYADEPLHVLADSQYVINILTKWRHGWKKRGWVKGDKKPIKNLDVIKALDAALAGRTVEFEWVHGHSGHPMNEAADDRAREAAEAYQTGADPDEGPGFVGSGQSDTAGDPPSSGAADYPSTDVGGSWGHSSGHSSESSPSASAAGPPAEVDIVSLENDFLRAWAQGDTPALAAMTAPHARRIWPNGFEGDTLDGACPPDPTATDMHVEKLGVTSWLVTYLLRWEGGSARESSVWISSGDEGDLRVVWHQATICS